MYEWKNAMTSDYECGFHYPVGAARFNAFCQAAVGVPVFFEDRATAVGHIVFAGLFNTCEVGNPQGDVFYQASLILRIRGEMVPPRMRGGDFGVWLWRPRVTAWSVTVFLRDVAADVKSPPCAVYLHEEDRYENHPAQGFHPVQFYRPSQTPGSIVHPVDIRYWST